MGKEADLESLRKRVAEFVAEREWEVYHNPKDLAIAIAVEASELLELFQWKSLEEVKTMLPQAKERISEELADVFIYGLSMANALSIDLSEAILRKIVKNQERFPVDRHRGNAYG